MKIARSALMLLLAVAVATVSFVSGSVSADEGHDHAKKGHDHESMMQKEKRITEALSALPVEDQKSAKAQRFCPIMTYDRLGMMGTPVKVSIDGKPVFLCCRACKDEAVKRGAKTVKTVAKLRDATKTLAELPMTERMAIEAQKYCAVADTSFLGSMGKPIKLEVKGKPIYLCCKGCSKKATTDPSGTLAKAEKLKKAGMLHGHDHQHSKQ